VRRPNGAAAGFRPVSPLEVGDTFSCTDVVDTLLLMVHPTGIRAMMVELFRPDFALAAIFGI
jgi:hypothetical protein